MIDKNDVKMPVQRDDIEIGDKVAKIEYLLDMLSEVENRQELRLKSDYYSRFHWFGGNTGRNDRSYFSYQEEAVYDFMFNLNKSGILSDQVGMGKTIEAGMIISELASRNELRSLLIIVPNEIMAQKWEYELENKFGIKPYTRNVGGVKEIYPQVTAIKNFEDFCRCIFNCIADQKFQTLVKHSYTHKYTPSGKEESFGDVIREYIMSDIRTAVNIINEAFDDEEIDDIRVEFTGDKFLIKCPDKVIEQAYKFDRDGSIAKFISEQSNKNIETAINHPFFITRYTKIINAELTGLYTLMGNYYATLPEEIAAISYTMANRYPFLVIPISYTDHEGEKSIPREFLNRILLPKVENYKHKYVTVKDGKNVQDFEEYRIVDFFIDVGYQTLIVDEVHDYIDVFAKVKRSDFHEKVGYDKYPSSEFNRYELFDDYYFIKKSSLYKKLKSLADKANRKIFLTATPIKSDMVDFYLLTLLASNKDSEAYKKIRQALDTAYPQSKKREETVSYLYDIYTGCIDNYSATHFRDFSEEFFTAEESTAGDRKSGFETKRFRYPYFNNTYLRDKRTDAEGIKKYLNSQLNYLMVEEIVIELILAYNAEKGDNTRGDFDITQTIKSITELLTQDPNFLQTRVVFRTLFNNSIRIRFEEDFTYVDESSERKEERSIKRIKDLLELPDGARRWHRTYRKYGIRHTRHQTYNLAGCEHISKLGKNKMERYQNLPVWPKRDGKVIFLVRDDVFFDCFLDVKREVKTEAGAAIDVKDLPNYERLAGTHADKQEKFENASAIFDYINDSMSGGDPENHEPSSSRYESVDIDDEGMADYKLALVNMLMADTDKKLGKVSNKVLLFAENNRDEILEWFKYQKCEPLYNPRETKLDPEKEKELAEKRKRYGLTELGRDWFVSEDAEHLSSYNGNLLIIIDPKRYEKGVDLQKADTIINFDINYCPLKMEQRIGRIDRIRPSNRVPAINIISFVPMNDMSGYVINFFANELKMFTQWMGETTGIVSVPEEENGKATGEDVSFEGKVYGLENYYSYIYELCNKDIPEKRIKEMAAEFSKRFSTPQQPVPVEKTILDFKFINKLRPYFDRMFRNSVSTHRDGYEVEGGKSIMRFNSALPAFRDCLSDKCQGCANYRICRDRTKPVRNSYDTFRKAMLDFFREGDKFYTDEQRLFQQQAGDIFSESGDFNITNITTKRIKDFNSAANQVKNLISAPKDDEPFTVPYEVFDKVFSAMKRLYWDTVVATYIKLILDQFHSQCDSVLKGARLFEKFVKTLSIADFMNNMEGAV